MVVGFYWGGWSVASTAEKMAKQRSELAVIAALAPVCADKFRALGCRTKPVAQGPGERGRKLITRPTREFASSLHTCVSSSTDDRSAQCMSSSTRAAPSPAAATRLIRAHATNIANRAPASPVAAVRPSSADTTVRQFRRPAATATAQARRRRRPRTPSPRRPPRRAPGRRSGRTAALSDARIAADQHQPAGARAAAVLIAASAAAIAASRPTMRSHVRSIPLTDRHQYRNSVRGPLTHPAPMAPAAIRPILEIDHFEYREEPHVRTTHLLRRARSRN